ncbi:MAG: DNA primase [Chloroflexi bacterium]|nr:DNA primase [Chloroflexota bacterium]
MSGSLSHFLLHTSPGEPLSVGAAAEIKQKLDLAELIGESVDLRKSGASFKGLCPFHGEKTPSFYVTPARETWKCFGCGRGGDIFSFAMEREGLTFPDALRRLAARAGVELSERTSREDARRKRLRETLEAAIAFYHQVLTAHPSGQPAMDYLRGRGFTDSTVETHQLGWAPDAWDALARQLIDRRGFRGEELEASGLATRRPGRSSVYDRFRARIIFPIRDPSGGATGLGGRILGTPATGERDQGPKYLNSPATPLFDKSRTLYLIDRAKGAIRRTGVAVLVEGNTDALMAHQQGFDNVIGSLGTALTAAQVELVTRYAPRIALAYDVDPAGQGAATFGATELSALIGEIERSPYRGRLTDVDVVRLPSGKDPDEVMRHEPETWRSATAERRPGDETGRQPIMEYLIDHYAQRHDPRTIAGRERLVNAVMPTLRQVGDPVRRDGYLQLLARRSGVEERVLLETLRRPAPAMAAVPRGGAAAGPARRIDLDAVMSSPDALDPQAVERALEPIESTLLRLVLIHPELVARLEGRLTAEMLVTTPARELWLAIVAGLGQDRRLDRTGFMASLEPTIGAIARTLFALSDPLPERQEDLILELDQCLLRLDKRRLDERFDYQRGELAEVESAGDGAARERIHREIESLSRERRELDQLMASTTLLNRRRPIADGLPSTAGGTL